MAIPSLNTIISNLVSFIQTQIPSLSMLTGTVARDVVVEAPAQVFNSVFTEISRVESMQTLTDSTAFQGTELDDVADDMGLTRNTGTNATVNITFRVPTITANIVIPAGTQVSTAPTNLTPTTITFSTISTAQFLLSNASSYYNSLTGLYELSVPSQAVNIGSSGNVAAFTLTVLNSTLTGAANLTVTNPLAASGGTGTETDASLLSRIVTKLTGNNVGTVNGILSIVNANPNVINSLVILPGDPEILRNQFGNSVDVVILGSALTQIAEPYVFSSTNLVVQLNRQPVSSVSSITGFVSSTPHTFIVGVDYTVNIDYVSIFEGTVNATSNITFLNTGTLPDNASTITITYTYNSLISTLQQEMNNPSNRVIGSDLLIKQATQVLVRVGATINTFAGFNHADVVAAVVTNLSNYFNSLNLGVAAPQTQIIAVIQNTPGVIEVVPGSLSLSAKRPTDGGFVTISGDVVAAEIEYLRPDTLTIV